MSISRKIQDIYIDCNATIIEAIKKMDAARRKLLIVTKNNVFHNLLSIGDIQRAIIKGVDLTTKIDCIDRREIKVATPSEDISEVKRQMYERRNDFMPIVDDSGSILDVIFWEDISPIKQDRPVLSLGLPVVIMAGGKGTRLLPLTNVLPKPLIPIGEQTMMEDIMDKFLECGCDCFFVSVNYKAEMIKRYFNDLGKPQYNISYFQEEKPCGTAGSLCLLKGQINSTFFVSNCDLLIDEDYSEIVKYHRDNNNEITVVAAIKNIDIPYGTLETREEGLLFGIVEKPTYTFKINTGMYILEPHLIEEIPENEFYHITFLIEKLVNEGRRVGVYPINEGSWIDVGNWDEYLKQFVKG